MSNIYDSLERRGYLPYEKYNECDKISLKERGVVYRLELARRLFVVKYQVDDYIIKEGTRCDKLILISLDSKQSEWIEIFVELKGRDISHAIKQLESTIQNKIFQSDSVKKKFARVVARSFPSNRSDTRFEKKRIDFLKKY